MQCRHILKKNFFVKIVAAYVIVGFVVMQLLLFFAWCWPFSQYWAVPPENRKLGSDGLAVLQWATATY